MIACTEYSPGKVSDCTVCGCSSEEDDLGISLVSKSDEFRIQNEKSCIKHEELCIKNEESCIKNDGFCRLRSRCT